MIKALALIALFVALIPLVGWLFMLGFDYVFGTNLQIELVSWKSVVAGLLLMALNGGSSK